MTRPRAGEVVDAHVHLVVGPDGEVEEGAGAVLRAMDRNGIAAALVSPAPGYLTPRGVEDSRRQNDGVAAALRRWPDRFLAGLGVVEPRHGGRALPEVDRALDDLGLRGLMFESDLNGQPIDAPAVIELVGRAATRDGVVVQFHTAPYSVLRSTFRLGRVAEQFPGVRFVNGTALTDTTHEAASLDVARRCPNVYLDLAFARSHLYPVENVLAALGPGRVLFGSGLPNTGTVLQLELVRMAGLQAADRDRVLGGSLLDLLDGVAA